MFESTENENLKTLSKEEKKSMKRKMGEDDRENENWPNCLFWMAKTHRFCSFKRAPGSKYCVNHYTADENSQIIENDPKKKRVPCPLDPSHSVYEYKLKKHLKICNKAKVETNMKQTTYFKEDININGDLLPTTYIEKPLSGSIPEIAERLVTKIRSIYKSIFPNDISLIESFPKDLEGFLNEKINKENKHQKLRHIYQQGSMLYNMNTHHLLKDGNIYIEMGAGRGMLSLLLEYLNHDVYNSNNNKYVLVDRGKNRFKCDRYMRHKEANAFQRISMDIKDLYIDGIPMIEENNRTDKEHKHDVIYISKHLCGVATDLTLKSLNEHGISRTEFETMKKMTCWCCSGASSRSKQNDKGSTSEESDPDNNDDKETAITETISTVSPGNKEHKYMDIFETIKSLNLNDDEYKLLGRQCKRIFDFGRKQYVEQLALSSTEQKHMKVDILYYCKEDESPENCLFLGYFD
ncbi:hypothetical protein WA158_007421 [Blastocystis sp. Blastoise]